MGISTKIDCQWGLILNCRIGNLVHYLSFIIISNAYVLQLHIDLQISHTLNVKDLYEFHPPDAKQVLRENKD